MGLLTYTALHCTALHRYEPRVGGEPPRQSESCAELQHISEREPDDWEEDPSLHPTQVVPQLPRLCTDYCEPRAQCSWRSQNSQ